jgi:hypothetical protein
MGLQVFETPFADSSPALLDQDTSKLTASRWIRTSIGAGVCVLWFFTTSAENTAMCGESSIGAQALAAPIDKAIDIVALGAVRYESSLLSQLAETAVVEQQPVPESDRKPIDNGGPQASPEQPEPVPQAAPVRNPEQALEQNQEKDGTEAVSPAPPAARDDDAEKTRRQQALDQEQVRVDALVRGLALLAAELEKARIVGLEAIKAVEAETRQREALEQEHGRAEELARKVGSLQVELNAARAGNSEAFQAAEVEAKQREAKQRDALEQEQARAEALAREVASLRTELESARASSEAARAAAADATQQQALERQVASPLPEADSAGKPSPEGAQAAMAEVDQKQAIELELNQERDEALGIARELSSLRGELEAIRAAGLETARAAETAKVEQQLAFGNERAKAEALARELAAARKEAEERSARLAAAHAEALQVADTNSAKLAEQERELAVERDRADALARELNSARNELESDKRQIAGVNALLVPQSREPADVGAPTRPADPSVRMETAGADTRSRVDEQRLLARANALLRQADISGARPLLEHALEHGSARAAFMLAETYDTRVLESWRARGISGDLAKARKLYERAQAGGIEDARKRIEALR